MTSTSSQYSRACARRFDRREFLDRVLDSNSHGTVNQDRIASVAEVFRLAGIRTGKNLSHNQEATAL